MVAFIPRLLASIFAPGYFAHDDHFLIIEAAQSWVDGHDYNNWLPWNQGDNPQATGHSFFYVGIHFLLFSLFDTLGLSEPKTNMFIIRLVHALWSLIVVRMGYRIAKHLSDERIALHVGLLLALFYFMPFLSVRTLTEIACVPLLMLAAERLLRTPHAIKHALVCGIYLGLAANIRFQTLAFSAGLGLVFLFTRPLQQSLILAVGIFFPVILIQGGLDLYIWETPFVELGEYVRYNVEHSESYISHPWYQYLIVICGVLIPPFSLFIIHGLVKIRKQALPLLGGLLLFLIIHSLISNKQERFILPIIPLFLTLGATGSLLWLKGASGRMKKIWKGVSYFTGTLNTIVLILLCFSYSKKSRIEIMSDLRSETNEVTHLLIENSVDKGYVLLPQYYADSWRFFQWPVNQIDEALIKRINGYPTQRQPNYAIFVGTEQLEERITALSQVLPGRLIEIAREEPGGLDQLLHWLNPVNRNETLILTKLEPEG